MLTTAVWLVTQQTNDCVTWEPKACVWEKQGAVRLPLLFGRHSLVYNRFSNVHLSFNSNRKLKDTILKVRERIIDVTKNNIISSPGFLGQRFNNLQRAALLTSF